MTKDELSKLYGEAMFQIEIWTARANDAKRKLIEIYNQETQKNETDKHHANGVNENGVLH